MLNIGVALRQRLLPALLLAGSVSVSAEPQIADKSGLEQALIQCRSEPSALLRLACYDNLFKTTEANVSQPAVMKRSDTVQKALLLEKQRPEHSTEFLTEQADGELSPEVIISTPALGIRPPRPVLIFSCQDNITRMQIAFFNPLSNDKSSTITLKTNTGTTFRSHWFVRDNGLLLESSRGLPGISEIQRLLNAETLTIESENKALNGISFQISGLSKAISPLRQACRW
ncbi:type VI secretion system-associated protein VasI [Pragia fontium]|uniref:Type VI secretion system protein VasI n=2 Tax=Pragia fontium TaxID=82985 RepID=A0AAJ4W8P2_9GAMM|nr:type VI secretion system-associated protein VasI [Pragia fontium]AKJ41618.1 hypothetical protein QQ39_05570 [Pragia fontium]SFC30922.1 type VI secretion system protein VasI [Pragia fontium DSM 5563 = ATCC 49100]SUB81841.1 type VI secretion-associated protein, VC_A0118 family [Pragia fontium]VEJ54400.1 type VI secretion-associated protein, VC_A0118 family [Pragia fontium]GKX63144.1 type VI secretion-associated protein [Pragia fontium]